VGPRDRHDECVIDGVDFFVSYTSADRPWAEWIAWELEYAGFSVVVQAWDIQPGSNFVHEMHEATRVAERTVAVLSPAFLASEFCEAEWGVALRRDPSGRERRLVPVRVRECDPDGLLGSVVYVDVVGLTESAARAKLLAGVTEGRSRPADAPLFPGARVRVAGDRVRRPDGGAAVFNVPVATRTFVGRAGVLERLADGLAAKRAVAVHGIDGVGKTQLAARYARQHRDSYDVVWWLHADKPATLRMNLVGLAVALGLVTDVAKESDAIDATRWWLQRTVRWLLIIDDASDPDAVADLVPEGTGGHVVITSRSAGDWRALGAQPIALDVFERHESCEFLAERCDEQDPDVLAAVAEALGDLPLALERAAGYANRQGIGLAGTLQAGILEPAASFAVAGGVCAPEPAALQGVLPRALRPEARALPFTGRDTQLAALNASWAAVDGETQVTVLLSGEAGIGKTRCVAELAASVRGEGARVLYGRCDDGRGAPFQPFVEALRGLMTSFDPAELRRRLGGLAPELAIVLPELVDFGDLPVTADAESARFALFEAIAAVLEVATSQRRMLLVIEDVHWAAPATLLMLRHVIRSPRPLALLIVVTYRSTEVHAGQLLAQLVADLQRDPNVTDIALTGLDRQSIGALVRAGFESSARVPPAGLIAMVHAETAGNPFFVRELVADMLESHVLAAPTAGAMAGTLPERLDLPDGLRSVILQRVARLAAPAQRLISVASVAGETNPISLLEPFFEGEEGVLDALDEAIAAGLIVEGQHDEFSFAHALVRRAVYDSLSVARRVRLHMRLGEALESREDAAQHVEALAYHFAQLASHGESQKAIRYAIAAGHAATARLAYEDAAAHFERGLDIVSRLPVAQPGAHFTLLLALGRTRWSTGDWDAARLAFEQAADIAGANGDATGAAEAALGFSGPLFFEVGAASTRAGVQLLQRALRMLGEADSAMKARLMGRLSAARAYCGEARSRNSDLAQRALAMARRCEDKPALVDVLAATYWATRGPDDAQLHLDMATELVRLADQVDDTRLLAYGRAWVATHHLESGDVPAALRELDQLRELATKRRDRFARWLCAVSDALQAFLRGHLERSETLAFEAVSCWSDDLELGPPTQVFGAQMIFVRREQGRLDELVGLVESYATQSPEVPAWRCALAEVYAQLGDREQAAHEMHMVGDLADLPKDALWMLSMTFIATTASMLGDTTRCQDAYDRLVAYADSCLVALAVMCEGSVARPLGMLATTLGRYAAAEEHFEHALALNATIQSDLWSAHTQFEYARMLRMRDHPGDQSRADGLVAASVQTAERLGLLALRERMRRWSSATQRSGRAQL
jgi:tetratricopeptide (TPR) repeat protein